MKKMLALALLLAAAPAFAADIDGNWMGSLDTPGGPAPIHYTFKADGATLTGSTTTPDGSAVPIKDGKIAGKKLSFTLVLDFGAGPTTFDITGEMSSPTELKLHWEFMGMPTDVMLKKT
ncbi:MAG TPA: hypothetical protein VFS52_09870 [Steroidobacteraceae bacterium]|jgi:hypothetical protein|nr:hypothetical protein [Steroidobacteraceae bacterium]